ncbi:hypothetical protein MMC07_002531 [Pseudocyphellaria aurata]|nr:hypothetical protein [Pseudocyphellaria aurata]
MLFAKTLAVGASFVVAALAQAKIISFTTLPTSVKAGVPTELKWIGGDNSAVTITLRQGDSNDLKDVAVLTSTGTGGSFTWTPSKSLPDADNYALQISQGSEINYTGLFSLSGGGSSTGSSSASATESSSASAKSSSASAKSSSASATESSSASVTSAATTLSLTSSQKSIVVATTKIPLNGTIPVIGTGASVGSSGIPITRNATLSRATLTATKSSAPSSSAAGSEGAGGSSAGSNPSSTSAPGPNSAANLASPLALVFCALIAVVYLG